MNSSLVSLRNPSLVSPRDSCLASLRAAALACAACLASTHAQTALLVDTAPPDLMVGWHFGRAVALHGDRLFIAGPQSIAAQKWSGDVQVFERAQDGVWNPTAAVQPPAPADNDQFGHSLAAFGDWLVVGAPNDEQSGALENAGAAYLYERQADASWALRTSLVLSTAKFADLFGAAVALRPGRALVTAPQRDFAVLDAGAAYVYELGAGGQWVQTAELRATVEKPFAYLGRSAALQGERALLGAPAGGEGTAHVFERAASGAWNDVATLRAPDAGAEDKFGYAVALDGDRAAIGAYKHKHQGVQRGAIYVFERNAAGTWAVQQEIRSDNGLGGEQFGWSVALEGDALLAGAPSSNEGEILSGRAYRFARALGGAWSQTHVLAMPTPQQSAYYGTAVALSAERCVVGAPFATTAGWTDGRAYVYDPTPLDASDSRLSVSQGGAISFELDAGFAHGGELALLLGSTSGTLPGQTIAPGVLLPLNPDAYFLYTLAQPNHAPLSGSLQLLGAGGAASAAFTLPAATSASLVGTTVHHAFATIAPASGAAGFASNARAIQLIP